MVDEVKNYEGTAADKVRWFFQDMGASDFWAERVSEVFNLTPTAAAHDATKAYREGDLVDAAINGVGTLGGGVTKAIFGGVMAKTADLGKLEIAQGLAKAGAKAQEIWDKTGWFQGTDSKWRFEISDQGATTKAQGSTLSEVLDHPQLYAAYPELRQARFTPAPKDTGEASITNGVREVAAPVGDTSITLHEVQHHVQHIEDFPLGTKANDPRYRETDGEREALKVQQRFETGDISLP